MIVLRRYRRAERRKVSSAQKNLVCTKKRSPACRRDLSKLYWTDASRALAPLAGILLAWALLTWALLTWALLLLAGLLLPAALLLAGLLTGILVLLARILILVAHSEFSFASCAARTNPHERIWLLGNRGSDGDIAWRWRVVSLAGGTQNIARGLAAVMAAVAAPGSHC
jgi:hypothetical protein